MKDFEITVRAKNNHLKERRDAAGLTCRELSERIGVQYGEYINLENMRISPLHRRTGEFRAIAQKVAAFYRCLPEDIFPEAVLVIENAKAVRKIDAEDALALMGNTGALLPDRVAMDGEAKEALKKALTTLRPRDKEILELRFGLNGNREHTLEEIGDLFEVDGQRIRQIEARALRELRHPSRSKLLIEAGALDSRDSGA